MKTQQDYFWESHRNCANLNDAFMELINDKENPLTNRDLEGLINLRPEVYGRFMGFLGKLKD